MKKTLVLGASENETRYSNMAVKRLLQHGHEVIALGKRKGRCHGVEIHNTPLPIEQLDTITLYLNPRNQANYYDYILSLHPQRIIFNPGTENPELWEKATAQGIACVGACTLVLLNTNQY
ncbi:MAG TPA: CoA-binding protein [Flavobacteriales bacterium]|jgi:predicted CoA-binding protein